MIQAAQCIFLINITNISFIIILLSCFFELSTANTAVSTTAVIITDYFTFFDVQTRIIM